MLPDRVSNPGPLTYESGALPIALRGPAKRYQVQFVPYVSLVDSLFAYHSIPCKIQQRLNLQQSLVPIYQFSPLHYQDFVLTLIAHFMHSMENLLWLALRQKTHLKCRSCSFSQS